MRIYIYDCGDDVTADAFYRQRVGTQCDFNAEVCSLRQFLHEVVIVRQLRASAVVVASPADADLFVVPVPSTYAYSYLRSLGTRTCDGCGVLETRLLAFLRAQPQWDRCGGHDHVFLSLRCPGGRPLANAGFSKLFNPSAATLARGVHLCLEPADVPQPRLAFHTVLVPYAEWRPELLDGSAAALTRRTSPKRRLLQYSGARINNLRSAVEAAMLTRCGDECVVRIRKSDRFHVPTGQAAQVAADMAESVFCFCPRGDSPTAKRIYDALFSRCIPLIAADAFEWPFERQVGARAFSLRVAERLATANATGLLSALRLLPDERVRRMQAALAAMSRRFRYGPPSSPAVPGEALDSILEELARRSALLRASGCARAGEQRHAGPRVAVELTTWLRDEWRSARAADFGAAGNVSQRPARSFEELVIAY